MGNARLRYEGQCGSKQRYWSKALAKRVRKKFFALDHTLMSIYLCPYCHYWHIGHRS